MFRSIFKIINNFQLSKSEKNYLLIVTALFIGYTVFHILYFPLFIDEALTYNGYTSKGFLTIVTNYNEPNNHIFFSILTWLFHFLPFDPLICLRLPNLLLGICASLSVYLIIRSIYGHRTAIIPHLFFTFSYFVTFYSVFARGYMLVIFMFILCFYCIQKLHQDFQSKYLYIYAICSIIGFYTIPVFLYVSASLIIYQLIVFYKEWNKLFILIKYHIVIGLVVFLLYLPIIYYNGLDSIINNEWTKKMSTDEIIACFKDRSIFGMYDKLLGINSFLIIGSFLLALAFLYWYKPLKNEKKMILFILLSFVLPFIFILIQHLVPGTRTWCYLLLPFSLGLAIFGNRLLLILPLRIWSIYLIGGLIIPVQIYIFYKAHPLAAKERDDSVNRLSLSIQNKHYTRFYIEDEPKSYVESFLQFDFTHEKTEFYNESYPLIDIPWKKLDCLILRKNSVFASSLPKNKYHIIYQNDDNVVYGK